MPRFMIEISHEDNVEACEYAKRAFYRTGSHFMTNAEFGCPDEVHKAWLIVEVDSKDDAERIIPPDYRKDALIITLEKLDLNDMEDMIEHHTN